MSFLRNLFPKKALSDAPEWTSFMEPTRFARLKTQVERGIRNRNPEAVIDWEQGVWTPAPGHGLSLGLMNLLQICNQLKERDWQSEIAKFASIPHIKAPDIKTMSYEEARPRLKVRLYPLDFHVPFMVTAPYCDSFYSALAVDFPDQVGLVPDECVEKWGIPVHELFKVGLENVLAEDEPTISTIPDNSDSSLVVFEGDSFFTATHALMLDRHTQFDDESGLLVIVPNRHMTMFLKVCRATPQKVILLGKMARDFYDKGPGSVSPDVLWLRRGQFERVDMKDGKASVSPELARHLTP